MLDFYKTDSYKPFLISIVLKENNLLRKENGKIDITC